MSNSAEKRFSVPDKLADSVYRGVHTGSGIGSISRERELREALKDHLGLGSKITTSPEGAMAGITLIGYVTTSTRLIGMLEGKDPDAIKDQILECLRFKPEESPQETLERLVAIAIENSQRINYH